MNKLYIIGNLTRDPEVRTTQSGVNVCSFSVAVNRKGKAEGTDYFRVTCWRGLADIAGKYLSKGKKVSVVGPVSVRAYTDRNGKANANIEVTANEVEFLSPRDSYEQQERQAIQNESKMEPVQTEDLPL